MTTNLYTKLLWEKICEYTKKAGRMAARPVLLLYMVMNSDKTPKSDKILIFSALAYLVLPVDLFSTKRFPILGWLDEVVSLTVAYQKVSKHITPEMEYEADMILDKWFPIFTKYKEVE